MSPPDAATMSATGSCRFVRRRFGHGWPSDAVTDQIGGAGGLPAARPRQIAVRRRRSDSQYQTAVKISHVFHRELCRCRIQVKRALNRQAEYERLKHRCYAINIFKNSKTRASLLGGGQQAGSWKALGRYCRSSGAQPNDGPNSGQGYWTRNHDPRCPVTKAHSDGAACHRSTGTTRLRVPALQIGSFCRRQFLARVAIPPLGTQTVAEMASKNCGESCPRPAELCPPAQAGLAGTANLGASSRAGAGCLRVAHHCRDCVLSETRR